LRQAAKLLQENGNADAVAADCSARRQSSSPSPRKQSLAGVPQDGAPAAVCPTRWPWPKVDNRDGGHLDTAPSHVDDD